MPIALLADKKIFAAFFKPLFEALNRAVHTRQCNELPDQHWLELGVTRTLMESPSFPENYNDRLHEPSELALFLFHKQSPKLSG